LRVRVDFGLLLPGIILFIIGGVLLLVFLLIAVVAFLFSFIAFWSGALSTILWLIVIPVILMIAGGVTALSGVSWWGRGGEGWFSGIARARAKMDRLRLSARVGELIGVVVSLIVFFFLYENQLRGAAFFTTNFGSTAEFLFYGPLLTGMLLSLARAFYWRRNAIRPFDSLNALFLAYSAFWLLSAFPFDFTHLADMFPTQLQFLFGWLNNDIGRVLFALAGIASLANFVYSFLLYVNVRNQMSHS
jgi:hypothetical protein